MAEHEEQVDWEDGDDSGDFWRGAEPVATVAASQQPVVAEEDDDDVISLLGDNPGMFVRMTERMTTDIRD
jgi:hypothetical protein